MLINGNWADANEGTTFDVINPANGEVVGQVPDGDAATAKAAIDAAATAFGSWSKTTAHARSAILYKAW